MQGLLSQPMVMEIWAPLLGARNGQERSDMFPQGSEAVAQVKEQLQLGPVDEQNAQYLAHAACAASTLDQDPAQPAPGGFSGNQVLQASQPFNEHDFPNDLLDDGIYSTLTDSMAFSDFSASANISDVQDERVI